ncbi:Hsp20/alpha crystallin family protein [Candidatus Woesebacteria bacterium]|nr:Hsp20/alpha crystallin family protein [Candidatus Woesebacteria bacterium]
MTDIVKRDPFRNLFTFPRWIEDFDFSSSQRGLKIHEGEKNIIVEAVVAGVPSKDVEVHIEDGVLTIKAEKSEEKKGKDEYSFGSYQYYYTAALSGGQWDMAEAEIEDGVLTLNIPKTEAARPRKITVKAKSKKKE